MSSGHINTLVSNIYHRRNMGSHSLTRQFPKAPGVLLLIDSSEDNTKHFTFIVILYHKPPRKLTRMG